MPIEFNCLSSLLKKAVLELRSTLGLSSSRFTESGNGNSTVQPSGGGIKIDQNLMSITEWKWELENKIDRAREVIRKNEFNMKILSLKEERSRNQKKAILP